MTSAATASIDRAHTVVRIQSRWSLESPGRTPVTHDRQDHPATIYMLNPERFVLPSLIAERVIAEKAPPCLL
jgi:hypothetical protein